MRVGVIGINYKSSDLNLRELIAKRCQMCFSNESDEAARLCCVVLSTCNRTEIYFSAADLTEAHSDILHLLRQDISEPFEHALYSYFGSDCFLHLATVTAGMDSIILAESEIQRQVKIAYENALLHRFLPSVMHFIFQKSLKIGKKVRCSFPILQSKNTLESTLFDLAGHFVADMSEAAILFIGNSEINRKIIHFFKKKEKHRITVCTRGLMSAEELVQNYNIKTVDWSQLSHWKDYEIVICGTNRPDYLLKPEHISSDSRTKIVFDLSLPRNVDPRLSRNPQITLMNIEELGQLIDKKRIIHLKEISASEELINSHVERYCALLHEKENRSVLCTV